MKNIILIGPMGVGKSTLGAMAAKATGWNFVEMDRVLEKKIGMTIAEFFTHNGEKAFRDLETEIARDIAKMQNTIVSTGGGVILKNENMVALKSTGFVVFIDRPVDNILQDLDVASRPILKGSADNLRRICDERRALYLKYSDNILPNDKSQEEAVSHLSEIAEIHENPNFAVIGDPIEHSKSPDIHLPVLTRYLDSVKYDKIHVKVGEIGEHIDALRKLRGFNLTMPHKLDIIPYLSSMSREAELCGSVNTVVCKNGKMYGYTTDGEGFFSGLESEGISCEGKHVVILGAGGVVRPIAMRACLTDGVKFGILARREEEAKSLADEVKSKIEDANIYNGELNVDTLAEKIADADILINATPQGMTGVDDKWKNLDFLSSLKKDAVVCDLIYSPEKTEFLKKAEELGHRCQNGMSMLIHQALVADEQYLESKLDRSELYNLVFEELK